VRYFSLCLLALLIFSVSRLKGQIQNSAEPESVNEDLSVRKLQDSVYIFTHSFPWASNGMFILMPGGEGILINTPCDDSGTESLLGWIGKKFGPLKLSAIVTGFHQDNLGGNEILLSRNIPVYGSDLTADLVNKKGRELKNVILNSVSLPQYEKYHLSYEKLKLVPPNRLFPIHDGLKLKYGNELIEVYFPGESHTIDNTVVYLHKRKILFGGCMIKGLEFDNPGYIGYANMAEWPKSVARVIERFGDCRVVVPGHGNSGGIELLPHMISVLNRWNK
jgi:metallo-beta-lactamase class B